MEQIQTLNGVPLKKQIARALFKQKMRALLLIAPLLIFILITFVIPITDMLLRSIDNSIVSETLPQTTTSLETWDPKSAQLPDEATYTTLYNDLKQAVEQKNHTKLGTRLNYENSGMSSLFRKVGKDVSKMQASLSYKEQFLAADKAWGDLKTWNLLKLYSPEYTNGYFLAALDMKKTPDGIERLPESDRIYLNLFARTIFMSIVITALCLLLGYPIAWLLANLPMRTSNLLMILVLLPFWTSLLVRTSAWKVLLQQQGVINDILVWLGMISHAGRLELINNQLGTLIAMTHILLPFMILPLYSVMRTIPPSYMRAAKSLGATDWTAFWRVYFPQTIAGIGAGAILTFILAIGYYITPELVGGTQGTFISNRIAYHISSSLNWGMAAALGTILLTLVLVLYWVYDRIVGIDKVKLG
ncbi:ABC transporter permease [uncultured Thiothrix sp.]|uniref:ABC transporter permease n=1 Tax=uncultured Thiothrix sp. TaxID=223185 RepID=UPI002621266B|nr:ABC transporter permease [uncultured Thiothrix sp.]HMT93304.1 ABC transporter permease [Thiolinea sp.]